MSVLVMILCDAAFVALFGVAMWRSGRDWTPDDDEEYGR